MTVLRTLRPHISSDGVYRAVGDTYYDDNKEHVAVRVEAGIVEVETEDAPKRGKSAAKTETKTEDQPKTEAGEVASQTLIED